MQRLQRAQRARDVMVSIARSRTFLHPYAQLTGLIQASTTVTEAS